MRLTLALGPVVGLLIAAAVTGCRSIPDVDGVPADELAPADLLASAEAAAARGEPVAAAVAAEWYLTHHFDEPGVAQARWVAAEARFEEGDLRAAFVHYRRLLDQDRFTEHSPVIADRVWKIGKTLVRKPGKYFGDLSPERDTGIEALNYMVTQFPRNEYADDAWKELAVTFAEDGAWQAAADVYERLVREYPDSEWCDLAMFEVAGAYANQSRGGRFDVDPLLQADAALVRYLAVFPDGNFVEEAAAERLRLKDEVTRHELAVADYYAQRGNPEGELLHLSNAATRFPETAAAEEARDRLAALGLVPSNDSNDLLRPRRDRPPWRQGPVARPAPPGAIGNPTTGR